MKKYISIIAALFLVGITASAQIDRSKMPQSGPSPEVNMTKPYTFELKNGLKVLVVTDEKLPQVTYSLTLDNPPVIEGNKSGVQSLTGSIMGKGTTKQDKDTFNEAVEFMGASVSIGVNGGFGFGLSKYKEDIMSLMSEAALMPNFTQEELDFEKSQLIDGIKSGENSAAAIAGRVRSALVYGTNHPAGEYATEETINSVTLQDVKDYYNTHFIPNNAYLVVSGDITKKEAKKLVKKNFKKWESKEVPTFNYPEVNDVPYTQINFIDVPNAVQTELAVINTSELKMTDDDYYAALIANYIYGGGFGSYLNLNLREANGYTYGARSSLGAGRNYKSRFTSSAKVRNMVTDSAVINTLSEMKRIRTEMVDEEALENAKAKFLGSFIMQSEDKEVSARRAVNIKINNLPDDFYKNYISNINKVTKEDVNRVANKYFKLDNSRIVLVGKASDALENVEKITFDGKKIPVKFYDKYGKKADRPSTIAIPDGVTATTVLNSYVEAIGGKSALENVNTTMSVASMDSPMGKIAMTEMRTKDNKWRMKVAMGDNVLSDQIYADGKGSISAMGQTQALEGDMLDAQRAESMLFPELNNQDKATLTGVEMIGDKKAYVIKWSDTKKSFYDMDSGLLIATETTQEQGGQKVNQKIMYSDYKTFDGIKFPTNLSMDMMGRKVSFNTEEVKVNSGVSDADFN